MKIASIRPYQPKLQFTGYAIKVEKPHIESEMERIYETVVDQDSVIYYYPCVDEKDSEIEKFVKKNSYKKYKNSIMPSSYGHLKQQTVEVKDRLPFTKSELKEYQKCDISKLETMFKIAKTLSFLEETHH